MHPTHGLTAGQLGIAFVSLSQKGFLGRQADDGVAGRIVFFDLLQISLHHFAAGHLLAVDGFGQGQRRHIGDDHEIILLSGVYSGGVF